MCMVMCISTTAYSPAPPTLPPTRTQTLTDTLTPPPIQAWERAFDPPTVDAGRQMQRGPGAALEAALDAFDREPTFGSWGGSNVGTCARTNGVPGDCARGMVGTWKVGPAPSDDVLSIDDCAEKCRGCARCMWISHSHAHRQCDWYHACNTSKLRRLFGAETFKTRHVERPE